MDKDMGPYEVKPWIEKGFGNFEYLVGYQIFFEGKAFYNCKGHGREEAERLATYLNLAFTQGMRKMSEINNQQLKEQLEKEQK